MDEILRQVLTFLMIAIIAVIILMRPYLGIVFIAASLTVIDILPSIPGFTSAVPLLGALTFVAFIIHRGKGSRKSLLRLAPIQILGLMFLFWILASNPEAALFGKIRNWMLTFAQLWILLWLSGELLDTPKKHDVFMWMYGMFSVASVLYAILQQGYIGSDVAESSRAYGLAEGSNTAARYFLIAMIFFNHLRTSMSRRITRFLALMGVLVTFLGVFFTVSRTGMLLMFVIIGTMFLLDRRTKRRLQVLVSFGAAFIALWFISDEVFTIIGTIIPSIQQGTDTAGLRYAFWETGWKMWLDHPIAGVGIGRYPEEIRYYAPELPRVVAHSTYIQVLSETGLIGLIIFLSLMVTSFLNLWRAGEPANENAYSLRNAWLLVFLVMFLGGITQTSYADKMVWLVMGVSQYFQYQHASRKYNPVISTKTTISPSMPVSLMRNEQRKMPINNLDRDHGGIQQHT